MMRDARSVPCRRRAASGGAALLGVIAMLWALSAPPAGAKARPPKPVPAWYMTAATVTDLTRQAKADACAFAKRQPKSSRLMLFDFGGARRYRDGTFGASLRQIRRFRNAGILKALKKAARTYHRCHRKGSVTIAYGNTNSMPDYMGMADAKEAGAHQAATVRRLDEFQRHDHHYGHQSAAAGGDIEPGFGFPGTSKRLVHGANGGSTYYDFGNAGGCPGQPGAQGCYNGWDLRDLGEVSMASHSVPLPEIYSPYEAIQWSRVQRHWDGDSSFAGVTGAYNEPLSPTQGWMALRRKAHDVHREVVSFRNSGSRGAATGVKPSVGAPMTGTIPAHLEASPEGFFSTSLIYPLRNEWVAADHRRFVAVDAGADPTDPSTGVVGIFRQNYLDVTQTQRVLEVPGSGALHLTAAPAGSARAALARPSAALGFTGENGITGTVDLNAPAVSVDATPAGSP